MKDLSKAASHRIDALIAVEAELCEREREAETALQRSNALAARGLIHSRIAQCKAALRLNTEL